MPLPLPLLTSVVDCVDFRQTVSPYLPQIYDLPTQVFQSLTNSTALKELYLSTNPLITGAALSLFLAPIFLIASEINRNYSQVDRFWSLLPTIYNTHFVIYAHAAGLPTARLDALLAASTLWSTRLTYNYWRKGGYSIGSEDYRWEILQKWMGPFLFFLLNVTFISFAQSVLLFSVTFPTYALLLCSKVTGDELSTVDLGFSQGIVALVFIAFVADQQQWNYQSAKKEYKATGKVPAGYRKEDLDLGFNTTGLWAWSRHPNFAAEQSVWVGMYLWSCYITNTYYNWTGYGALSYLMLFQGSTWFTELVSSRKYPDYAEYQKHVGMFVPAFGGKWPSNYKGKNSVKSEIRKK